MSKELYSEGLKHLSSILLKAQGRPDAETQSDIDIGYECMRLRVVLDGMNAHPKRPQDVEEFIDEHELVSSSGSEVNSLIRASDLRAWMTGHVRVPVEPNDAMQAAGASAIRIETTALNKLWTANAVFRAMLNASKGE